MAVFMSASTQARPALRFNGARRAFSCSNEVEMSKPESRGPGRAPLPAARANAFFHPLGRTGSVTAAANRAQLRRAANFQTVPAIGPAL